MFLLQDNNDHAPKFIADVLTKSIHERAILGTKVIAVQATDKDKGDNSRIQYSLQSGMFASCYQKCVAM